MLQQLQAWTFENTDQGVCSNLPANQYLHVYPNNEINITSHSFDTVMVKGTLI